MKHFLAIYDIRDAQRLQKVAKTMESYGVRVQKSVFEIEADDRTIAVLRRKIKQIIEEEDFVVYFDVCRRDWEKREKYGPEEFMDTDEQSFYII